MKAITHKWAGAEWLAASGYAKGGISELGRNVADLLGYLEFGLYHMHEDDLRKANWASDRFIQVGYRPSLATFDGDALTRLVILCHEMEVRCDIGPASRTGLRLFFSPRKGREGGIAERHPSIEDAIERVRESVAVQARVESPG